MDMDGGRMRKRGQEGVCYLRDHKHLKKFKFFLSPPLKKIVTTSFFHDWDMALLGSFGRTYTDTQRLQAAGRVNIIKRFGLGRLRVFHFFLSGPGAGSSSPGRGILPFFLLLVFVVLLAGSSACLCLWHLVVDRQKLYKQERCAVISLIISIDLQVQSCSWWCLCFSFLAPQTTPSHPHKNSPLASIPSFD